LNNNQDDIFWWNAFKHGDRSAFDSLFRQYYPFLLNYGKSICPDKDTVDDSIQDLFIELWQSRASAEIRSLKAYLLKALKYKLFRHFRKKEFKSEDFIPENTAFEISHDLFIINQETEQQNTKAIINALNRLPARQKEIIYLKIYQGLSYEEVSEVMNVNYQVARNLFYQAIKSLRQILTTL
jgi:RNA polymerase sigma factor (sigma-70 family)